MSTPIPSDDPVILPTVEELRIREWRITELRRSGYDQEAAGLIGRDLDVDLHRACSLLLNGCSVELALRILL